MNRLFLKKTPGEKQGQQCSRKNMVGMAEILIGHAHETGVEIGEDLQILG